MKSGEKPMKVDFLLSHYSLLISSINQEIILRILRMSGKLFKICNATFMLQSKWPKTQQIPNEGKNVYFRAPSFERHLRQRKCSQKRHNNKPHLARAGRNDSRVFCMPKIAGASSGQQGTVISNILFYKYTYCSISIINSSITRWVFCI
jgi:hypothetical protein